MGIVRARDDSRNNAPLRPAASCDTALAEGPVRLSCTSHSEATPVGDSLHSSPEDGRWATFTCLPLVDNGFVRRTHQGGQLRLAQPACATNRANLLSVVVGHNGPGQWCATIDWANRPPIVRPPKRPGRGRSRAGPEAAKGRPRVIGHRQPAVSRRRPQRFDVHTDEQREHR